MAAKTDQTSFVRAQFANKTRPKRPQFPPGTPLFLTWWIDGVLPPMSPGILNEVEKLTGRERLVRIEKLLDAAKHGPKWLADERVAATVCETIEQGDVEFHNYQLHSYVVMPNHVHLLVTPLGDISHFMAKVKGVSARNANLILGRTGQRFWATWSYDHFSRGPENFAKMQNYIAKNPVWAKLAAKPEDFEWSNAHRGPATARPAKSPEPE
jgi:REP element-mobilizing transposase RayT